MLIQTLDGIPIHCLPDNAMCAAAYKSPIELLECPIGHDACIPEGCSNYGGILMKKYDMSKTADLVHESERLCRATSNCGDCRLQDNCIHCVDFNEITKIVAKWSEENPEKRTLTKQERAFIEGINVDIIDCQIAKHPNRAWLESQRNTKTYSIPLNLPFKSIPAGECIPIKTLLTWEVSDE